jgi:hypothetical protein
VYKSPGISRRKAGDLLSFLDPLADDEICKQDIPRLLNLGINTLLITAFNADRDHRTCMQLLSDAGIYVLVAINAASEINTQVNREVGSPIGYVSTNHFYRAVDFFQRWNNTLGLSLFIEDHSREGNETLYVLPLQKGSIREVKEYIKSREYRNIPVGIIGSEHAAHRFNIPQYMICGDGGLSADFYTTWPLCWDVDRWCTNASSRYSELRDSFRDYQRPTILTEGCRKGKTYDFERYQELYSPAMTDIFSGSIFLEWLIRPDIEEPDEHDPCPWSLSEY